MKAVILCGGKGLRLSGQSDYTSKPLVRVGGMPILWHIMKMYKQYGVKEFILCLGHNGDVIKDYFLNMDWRNNDFQLQIDESGIKTKLYGVSEAWNIIFADTGSDAMTGARIKRVKKYIEDEEFMLTYGDGVSDIPIDKLAEFHKQKGKIVTVTGIKPISVYGIIDVQEGVAVKFQEKPIMDGWVNGGFFILNRKVFDYISDDEQCIWEDEPIKQLVQDGELAVYQHDGFWKSIDTVKDVQSINDMWGNNIKPWVTW